MVGSLRFQPFKRKNVRQRAKTLNFSSSMSDLMEISNAESFIELLLERNEIEINDLIGHGLDDPLRYSPNCQLYS
jgi:hypothetical protein